jgi:hypothetical protein
MRVRNESTNACPVGPTPGASVVPRANTTSTSGQACADAGRTGALSGAKAAAVTAPTKTTKLHPLTA